MTEGFFISIVGMGAVFLILTIIMFLMIGIERVFRAEERVLEEGADLREGLPIIEPVQRDISVSPTSIEVNGERFSGAVGGEGLPLIEHTGLSIGPRIRDVGRERIWRLAHPFSIGGYWTRRGWTGRH